MDETRKVDHADPAHGTYEDGTCDLCDWCPVCERVQEYDGEFCTVCGREWGVTGNEAPSDEER